MRLNRAQQILAEVEATYEKIAESFAKTRNRTWLEMEVLATHLKPGWVILDIGCGNGRLYQTLADKSIIYHGLDQSASLVDIAKHTYPEIAANLKIGSVLNLPYNENKFEAVFMIAVLQHVPSFEFRLQALKEVHRILKKGGLLLMTNWNFWDRENLGKFLKNLPRLFWPGDDWGDLFVPWRADGKLAQRYYHAFSKQELQKLCFLAGFTEIEFWGAGVRGGERKSVKINPDQAIQWVSVWSVT